MGGLPALAESGADKLPLAHPRPIEQKNPD